MKKYITLYYRLRAMEPAEIARRSWLAAADSWRSRFSRDDVLRQAGGGAGCVQRLLDRPLTGMEEPALDTMGRFLDPREIISRAGAALAGEQVLFGQKVAIPGPVDWLRDPFGGERLSKKHQRFLWSGRYRGAEADLRSIWELNRLQILVLLGRAYRLTGEKRYAAGLGKMIASWDEANPYMRTVNWSNALEVGLRSFSLVLGVSYIRGYEEVLDKNFRERLASLFYLHGAYLYGHLSTGSTGFNHLAGEAAALAVLGSVFPGMKNAGLWRKRGREALERSVLRLILPDGGPLEGSMHYLAFVCRLAVVSSVLCRAHEGESLLSDQARERLARAYRFLCSVTDRGRAVSEFGDSDNASVPGAAPADALARYRGTLNLLWLFLDKEPLGHMFEPDEDSLWLFGPEAVGKGASAVQIEKKSQVEHFRESGHCVVSSAGGEGDLSEHRSPHLFLRFECGPWGDGRIWAHSHADRLSFSLFLAGRPFFIDPGTGAYLAHRTMREYFRSTPAHNTVTKDSKSQSEPLAPFLWRGPVISKLTRLEDTSGKVVLEGVHWGYKGRGKGSGGLVHRRRLTIHNEKPGCLLEIEDFLETGSACEVCISFILHPDCIVEEAQGGGGEGGGLIHIANRGVSLSLKADERCRVHLHRGGKDPLLGWYSPGFMQWQPCRQILCQARIERGDCALKTIVKLDGFV
ncbi:MAG: alginate lyase family protein [Gemmatimonadota bacterium]|nr:alginate lyase family protein [Gemmatimonadota bacterium]